MPKNLESNLNKGLTNSVLNQPHESQNLTRTRIHESKPATQSKDHKARPIAPNQHTPLQFLVAFRWMGAGIDTGGQIQWLPSMLQSLLQHRRSSGELNSGGAALLRPESSLIQSLSSLSLSRGSLLSLSLLLSLFLFFSSLSRSSLSIFPSHS